MVDFNRYLRNAGNLGYSLLDNVIGFDDGYDTTGELLGRAFREDPIGTAKAIGSGALDSVIGAVQDPIGTIKDTATGIASSAKSASGGAAAYLPEGVELKDATYEQIRDANEAFLADITNVASLVPAVKGTASAIRAADNAVGADARGLIRAVAQGDMEGVGEVFQRGREGQSLSAAKGPTKDQLDPYGYQDRKMRRPFNEVEVRQKDLGENLKRTPISWEDMEGKVVLPFYGDRTSRGLLVEGVTDFDFDKPVYTEGGVDYMVGPAAQKDSAIWASNQNIITRLSNEAKKAQDLYPDREIVGVTGSMKPNANDFATFTGEAMAELVQASKITKKAAKEFDAKMRAFDPTFVGTHSPDLRKWAKNATPDNRKTFIRLIDTAPSQAAGYPSPAEARKAVTDATQYDLPAGMFGLGVGAIDINAPLLSNVAKEGFGLASFPHSTYNTVMTGLGKGSLPPVHQSLLFKDVYDEISGNLDKRGNPLTEANMTHAIKTKIPAQLMTPQIIDGILTSLARQER